MRKDYFYQETYPIIDVELIGPKSNLAVKALVDSGATISLFQAEIAELLGIDIKKGKEIILSGIGGKVKGYIHKMPIRTNGYQFDCKIAFSKKIEASVNILGRDNFFLPFLITFNEKLKKVLIEENK